MAITQLNNFGIGNFDLTAIEETIVKAFKGKLDVTLSNYDDDSAPLVKVGSVFENNGTLFIIDTSDITPTGYSGISVSTTFYLYYDESAEAFIYDSTAPTWSDTLQGWYNGNDRALFSMQKDSGGTLYGGKTLLNSYSAQRTRWSKNIYFKNATKLVIGQSMQSWVPVSQDFISCVGQLKDSTIDSGIACSIRGIVNNGFNNVGVIYTITSTGNQATINFNYVSGVGSFEHIELMTVYDSVT